MDRNQRPLGRQEHVTSGNGHVGKGQKASSQHGPSTDHNRASGNSYNSSPRPQGGKRPRRAGRMSVSGIAVIAVIYFIYSFFFGGSSDDYDTEPLVQQAAPVESGNKPASSDSSNSPYFDIAPEPASSGSGFTTYAPAETAGTLDDSTVSSARDKYTQLLGNGRDTVTLMVYMCGTDLESSYGMATADLMEMTKASISDNVNVIVCTGGCTKWKNSIISNSVNQIYRVRAGGLERLVDNFGKSSMTAPDNLTSFIKWSTSNYPANRYQLILWDHGGGTLSGYGYDEKYKSSRSMTIDQIGTALKNGGTTFDFVGFDACLMATLETALTVEPYADYLIASEESEPGYGWYYTDWLNTLSGNTSTATTKLGKQICDTFISDNKSKGDGSSMTLSVLDLAELSATVPALFDDFSASLNKEISDGNYSTISNARGRAREYARSSKIDQIDLITFCEDLNSKESLALADALKSVVKYNLCTRDMAGSQGVSIYFPYRSLNYLQTVLATYNNINISDNYRKAVKSFASLQTTGQVGAGGSSSPLDQYVHGYSSSSSSSDGYYSSYGSLEDLMDIFFSAAGMNKGMDINGLNADNSDWLDYDLMTDAADYVEDNRFDPTAMKWTDKNGEKVMKLTDEQWDLIQTVELSVMFDDGEGYIDLGYDNLFNFDEDGDLIGSWDGTWLAIDGNIVPYYLVSAIGDTEGSYTITGRIPALLNDESVDIMVVFTNINPYGMVLGARRVYDDENETLTEAKGLIPIENGDRIQPLCDYYYLNGDFDGQYYFNDEFTISGTPEISNVELDEPEAASVAYCLTDIYNNHFWTPEL